MADFPASVPSITNPAAHDTLASVPHSTQHEHANENLAAIGAKVGTGSGTPTIGTMLRGSGTGSSAWLTSTYLDIREYLASTDSSDNTTAIQEALTAAATTTRRVFVPPGTWITGRLTIPSGVTLFGAGWSSVLKAKASLDDEVLSNSDTVSGNTDITIRSLKIDGNKASQTASIGAHGIYMFAVSRLLIEDVWVHECEGHGFFIFANDTAEGVRLSDCLSTSCGTDPLSNYGSAFAIGAYGTTLTNCVALDSAKAGFRVVGDDLTLTNCIARRCTRGLTNIGDLTNLTINGGIFADSQNDPAGNGIYILGADKVALNGVICHDNHGSGVLLGNGCTRVTITGGLFYNNGKHADAPAALAEGRDGITIKNTGAAVSGVTIDGIHAFDDQDTPTQDHGISIADSSEYVSVVGCDLRGNQTGPFLNTSTGPGIRVAHATIPGNKLPVLESISPVTVTGTTDATTLRTTTIPGGQLGYGAMGRGFRVSAAGTVSGTAGTKIIRVVFGSFTQIVISQLAAAEDDWSIVMEVYDASTASSDDQRLVIRTHQASALEVFDFGTATEDLASDVTVAITGQLGDAADSIVSRVWYIEPLV